MKKKQTKEYFIFADFFFVSHHNYTHMRVHIRLLSIQQHEKKGDKKRREKENTRARSFILRRLYYHKEKKNS